MNKEKLKNKALKIKAEIGDAQQHVINALNHVSDYKRYFREDIKKLEISELKAELKRRKELK